MEEADRPCEASLAGDWW